MCSHYGCWWYNNTVATDDIKNKELDEIIEKQLKERNDYLKKNKDQWI